jgi:peptidoglycan/LPS O-acetylase OafA/YrhL
VRALDGVRGAAVIGDVLFHGGYLRGGYLGVDLFFVLSGYLITSLLLAETANDGRVNLFAFWARRARRLLPALVLVLAGVAIYASVLAAPTELGRIRGDAIATLAYVANWRFVFSGFDYWAQFRAPSPLGHTWSLAIEEQFYILWPLVVVVVTRWWGRADRRPEAVARRVFLTAAGAAVGLVAWSAYLWVRTYDTMRIYYGTDTRAPAILAGAALAAWMAWRGPVRARGRRRALEAMAVGAVVVLAIAWTRGDGAWLYHGGLLACALAAVVVLAAASHPDRGPIARLLTLRPLVALGVISYGIYLFHWPIFVVLDPARTGLDGWRLFVVRCAATLAVAIVSYVLVERPIRSQRVLSVRARLLSPVVATGLVVGLIGATAGATAQGSPAPTRERVIRQVAVATREHATRVLVVGNSIASSLATDGLSRLTTEPRTEVVDDGIYSCDFPPTPLVRDAHVDQPSKPIDCSANWKMVVGTFHPDIAVLVLGDVHEQRYLYGEHWVSACDPEFVPHFLDALDRGVATLGSHGARVVLTTSAYANSLGGEATNRPIRALTRCGNSLLRAFAAQHTLPLVDLQQLVCPDGDTCRQSLYGASLRPDGMHYAGAGAELVGAWMLRQLGIAAVARA